MNHRFGDLFTEIIFGRLFHFLQDARGNFRRRHLLAAGFDPGVAVLRLDDFVGHQVDVALHHLFVKSAPDQALDREDGVGRIGDRLALGGLPHQHFVVLGEGDDGRRGTVSLAVFDDLGLVAFDHRHAGVGGAQINTDDFCHVS